MRTRIVFCLVKIDKKLDEKLCQILIFSCFFPPFRYTFMLDGFVLLLNYSRVHVCDVSCSVSREGIKNCVFVCGK